VNQREWENERLRRKLSAYDLAHLPFQPTRRDVLALHARKDALTLQLQNKKGRGR
jgi:HAMP domain-containing protein